MVSPARPAFVHRDNRDGTTESICRQCSVTVCTAVWEADLDRAEKNHACDPEQMAHRNRIAGRNAIEGAKP